MAISRINMANFGIAEGRLTRDPKVIENDGGTTYLFTVAVDRDYKNRKGETQTDFLPFTGFVAKGNKKGAFPYLEKGKQVKITYGVQSYAETKDGKASYGTTLRVNDIRLGNSPKKDQEPAQNREKSAAPDIASPAD